MFDTYKEYGSLHAAARNRSRDEWFKLAVESMEADVVVDDIPVPAAPPADVQAVFHGVGGKNGMISARPLFNYLMNAWEAQGREEIGSLLDFGCGYGRFMRLFVREVAEGGLYGVDPLGKALQMARMSFPFGAYLKTQFLPPLPFRDNFFDVIFASSVFSHLPEHLALAWIVEMHRVLRPGGMLVATTHSVSLLGLITAMKKGEEPMTSPWHKGLCNMLVDPDAALQAHQDGQYVYLDTGGGNELPPGTYGDAFVPEAYIKSIWGRFLKVVDFVDDPARVPQAAFVLQKTD